MARLNRCQKHRCRKVIDCVVESTPNIPGKCQLARDHEGTVWLIFWDNTSIKLAALLLFGAAFFLML